MTRSWCWGRRWRGMSWPSRVSGRPTSFPRFAWEPCAEPWCRPSRPRPATPLLALAISVIIFAAGINVWLTLLAAIAAGVAGLLTGAATQALLLKTAGPRQATQVMTLWAIAWAGSKPLASLADGWLASHVGLLRAGMVLTAPAIIVALLELFLRPRVRNWLKARMRNHNAAHPAIRPAL